MQWNEVTSSSRIAAIIIFFGVVPALSFYFGMVYQETKQVTDFALEQSTMTAHQVDPSEAESIVVPEQHKCVETGGVRECSLTINDHEYQFQYFHDERKISVLRTGENIQSLVVESGIDPGFNAAGMMLATDINFDGYDDLALRTCQGATGNVCWDYYLYNPATQTFSYSKEFSDTDGEPNPLTKQIHAHFRLGCAGGCYIQSTYAVENNTPVLIEEVSQDYDDEIEVFINVRKILVDGEFVTATTTVTY